MTTFNLTNNVHCGGNNLNTKIRRAAFAGQFYPADSSKLTKAIDYFLDDAVKDDFGKPIALIAPHAGYIYAGQIIADSYNQIKNYKYDLIVILGTNHTTAGFNKIGIYPGTGFQTPLGISEIDTQAAEELIKEGSDCVYNEEIHSKEHSVEVQIPFIQHIFPNVKILPVVIGESNIKLCANFGNALSKILKNRNALIIASSDLSHYPAFEDAINVDKKTLEAASSLNTEYFEKEISTNMSEDISNLVTCACGEGPIIAAMTAAKGLGANNGIIVSYANSGNCLIGNRQKVVGYGSVIFSSGNEKHQKDVFPEVSSEQKIFELKDSDKKSLLTFTRRSIRQYLETETVPLARGFNAMLENKLGAFVTLRIKGELRGCIGYMQEDLPLCEVVGSMAIQSAFNDSRFYPLTLDELLKTQIEISVLTPYKLIGSSDEIVLGRDGVVIRKNNRQAVFLPQVATEMNWNKEQLLENLCRKAGLQSDDWKDAQLFTFQAEVFEESEFR
ncbi:MAG: AmmeMemoRadiSam system protein B [Bacteroidetes bacterium]|nr:AmmeMemoRadiSam system protein B [Bacteroidota bacterium]